jgi:hypothetical protein
VSDYLNEGAKIVKSPCCSLDTVLGNVSTVIS